MIDSEPITGADIVAGLRRVGVTDDTVAIAHVSLRSFGTRVDGGAATVVEALRTVCDTVIMMAGSDEPQLPFGPPGTARPHNAYPIAADWETFDAAVEAATPCHPGLPVAGWLGATSEAIRLAPGAVRGPHPLYSFVGVGRRAADLIGQERDDDMLGSVAAAAELGGQVLLLGVGHHANTTIHLAEQRVGRGRFFRYARAASGVWCELPNISGESHRFDDLEPRFRPYTAEATVGACRIRRIAMADVLAETTAAIDADPAVGLCDVDGCRCTAALAQYRAVHA